jgi:hypothetical protein
MEIPNDGTQPEDVQQKYWLIFRFVAIWHVILWEPGEPGKLGRFKMTNGSRRQGPADNNRVLNQRGLTRGGGSST